MPNTEYLERIAATRAFTGIAGYGRPLKSIRSITLDKSSPVMVRTDSPG